MHNACSLIFHNDIIQDSAWEIACEKCQFFSSVEFGHNLNFIAILSTVFFLQYMYVVQGQ